MRVARRSLGPRVAVVVLLAGCASFRPKRPPTPAPERSATMVARGDELAQKDPRAAHELYRSVLRDRPRDPVAPEALYRLALLYVAPDGPLHDYRAARTAFERLLTEYPDNPHAIEARAWSAALSELERTEAESAKLRANLERLKELDMEQERR